MAYPFLPFCGMLLFFLFDSNAIAVCQKQIAVPNNSLLYCSEKCKRQDALSSSPPLFHQSMSSAMLTDLRSNSSTKLASFEPSRREQWGITPSPIQDAALFTIPEDSHDSTSTGSIPPFYPVTRRS